jgi:hypothetical protein
VNPAFALHTHVSGTVMILSCVAVLSIRRVNRVDRAAAPIWIFRPSELAIAA